MSAYGVERKGRGVVSHVDYISERNKPQLDKSLETIAYAQHKTVAIVEQIVNGVLYARITEECGNELARTVRLVASGKAPGYHDYLGLLNSLFKVRGAFLQSSC